MLVYKNAYISIHAPRAGGDWIYPPAPPILFISIHAPRAGGDTNANNQVSAWSEISIHAPRAGGDRCITGSWWAYTRFQSTPPVRGATRVEPERQTGIADFNPRPPCGGRRTNSALCCSMFEFQSTPPVRGATRSRRGVQPPEDISIHAPRAGGDSQRFARNVRGKNDFNPRPPCGGRRPCRPPRPRR